jgi:hypothetical protein
MAEVEIESADGTVEGIDLIGGFPTKDNLDEFLVYVDEELIGFDRSNRLYTITERLIPWVKNTGMHSYFVFLLHFVVFCYC